MTADSLYLAPDTTIANLFTMINSDITRRIGKINWCFLTVCCGMFINRHLALCIVACAYTSLSRRMVSPLTNAFADSLIPNFADQTCHQRLPAQT